MIHRRSFISSIISTIAIPFSSCWFERKTGIISNRFFGRMDYQNNVFDVHPEILRSEGAKVFVDEKEIRLACFIDTNLGIVKTYDVFGDGRARVRFPEDGPKYFIGREVHYVIGEVVCETLRGNVEVRLGGRNVKTGIFNF